MLYIQVYWKREIRASVQDEPTIGTTTVVWNRGGNYNNANSSCSNGNNNRITKINAINNRPTCPRRVFSQVGVPRSMVYECLLKKGLIKPVDSVPLSNPLPSKYDSTKYCTFHQMNGHSTNYCPILHHEIQDLIYNKVILAPNTKPNVGSQPYANHTPQNPKINHINTYATPFDPTRYIVPADQPKPIFPSPKDDIVINVVAAVNEKLVCLDDLLDLLASKAKVEKVN